MTARSEVPTTVKSEVPTSVVSQEPLTRPRDLVWVDRPGGYRTYESAFYVGRGRNTFVRLGENLLHWEVKKRSGFDIGSEAATPRVAPGQEPTIFVRLAGFRLPEPARVIDVFEAGDRIGFTYGTKPGHPITGEESFILVHNPDDRIFLVLRSASLPGDGIWRLGAPAVRIAQIIYRRRYARALRAPAQN